MGALLIEGPKWCGKTRSSLEFSHSAFYTMDNQELAKILPDEVLRGDTPRLIDEWQLEPVLWDRARRLIDTRELPGQFIFTGSSTPEKEQPVHSGVGRFALVRMHPMSLYESKESDGTISLSTLFEEKTIKMHQSPYSLSHILWALVRGGWPASLSLEKKAAALLAGNYVKLMQKREFPTSRKGAPLDRAKLTLFIRALARVSAQTANLSTIIADVRERAGTLARDTAENYLNGLHNVFFAIDQPAWNVSLRAKVILRQTPKRHLADPSLAAAALSATPEKLRHDFRTLGHLFESLCFRDVSIYAQSMEGELSFYKDSSNFEVDQIINLADGRWAAIEVKLGDDQLDDAAVKLKELLNRVDTRHIGAPAFLAILYAGQYAYTREDGVHVIPITCLRP